MPGRLPFPLPGRATPGNSGGAAPLLLPLVAAVGVNNLTATGANLIGSINPQGLSGSWWFVYGTSPQFGAQTASQPITATSIPRAETITLSGLSTGTTYYFAMVGQTAAGTVTSAPVSFVPTSAAPVPDPANLPTEVGTPQVGTPHYRFPIAFNPATGVGVVEQDTLDEVFSNVLSILACPAGACPELPTFGRPDPTFGTAPLDPSGLVAAIRKLEPRATEQTLSQAVGDPNAGSWEIMLTTELAGNDR